MIIYLLQQKLNLFLYFIVLILFAGFFSFSVSAETYKTVQDGNWQDSNVWEGGIIPNPTGGFPNNSEILINHNVILDTDFNARQNTNTLKFFIGINNPGASLIVAGKFVIQKTIILIIYENSTLQIGLQPGDEFYDYCLVPFDSDNLDQIPPELSLFRVNGSGSPSLNIHPNGTFLLYGHFLVENNFEINVAPDGNFIVKGGFEANNNAEVKFTGSGGDIGCDMIFKNTASIELNGGALNVGGDLLFMNGGDIFLQNGSSVNVIGMICSSPGGGSAELNISGDSSTLPPNSVIAGEICNTVTIAEAILLPIELLSFTSEVTPGNVILNWSTASEINNDYFSIERSHDMESWDVIGLLQGAGNSNQVIDYSFTDMMPVDGIGYYRLKQTDFDGKFEYFGPLSVNFIPEAEDMDFKVTKSPDQWVINLPDQQEYQVEVYSISGLQIFSGSCKDQLYLPAPDHTVVIHVFNEKFNSSRIEL